MYERNHCVQSPYFPVGVYTQHRKKVTYTIRRLPVLEGKRGDGTCNIQKCEQGRWRWEEIREQALRTLGGRGIVFQAEGTANAWWK